MGRQLRIVVMVCAFAASPAWLRAEEVIADSVDDWSTAGTQGENDWFSGYYDQSADADGTYAVGDFRPFLNDGTGTPETDPVEVNHWNGTTWDFEANPPWTLLGQEEAHPNGSNQPQGVHWVVRRWVAPAGETQAAIEWHTRKTNTSGGNGVTGIVFLNGAQLDRETLAFNDGDGVSRRVFVDLTAGDVVDLALSPEGTDGTDNDGSDSSATRLTIIRDPDLPRPPALADSLRDWSAVGFQKWRGWSNGFYNLTLDPDSTYSPGELELFLNDGSGVISATNHWDGSSYRLTDNPGATGGPWTFLAQEDLHPNGTNSGVSEEHWVIRRWVVDLTGESSYWENFDRFTDGAQDLRDGSIISSNNGVASVQGGALRLTSDAQPSTAAAFRIPALVGSSEGWTATFDFLLVDSVGGGAPADGFSFNYGPIPSDPGNHGMAEEGYGVGLSVEFDTWDNGTVELEHGYNVAVDAVDVPGGFEQTEILGDGGIIQGMAVISWNPSDGVNLSVDLGDGSGLTAIFTDLATPGFSGDESYSFAFSARTGGATEDLLIDNLIIEADDPPVPGPTAVEMTYHVRAVNPGGTGTTAILFLNGEELDRATTSDAAGVDRQHFAVVEHGDAIDLALTPEGIGGDRSDGADGSATRLVIRTDVGCDAANTSPGADSLADWSTTGTQGENRWVYGYYDQRDDVEAGNGVYDKNDFIAFLNDGSGVVSADPAVGGWQASTNHWDGTKWDLLVNSAPVSHGPWTEVSQAGGHPAANGQTDPSVHWAIRRWESRVDGAVQISGTAHNFGAGGDGTVVRVFQEGVELLATRTDGEAVPFSVRTVVATGDAIDVVIDPDGAGVLDAGDPSTLDLISDGSDGTDLSVLIEEIEYVLDCAQQLAGDCNQDGQRNTTDVICLIKTSFPGFFLLDRGAVELPCETSDGNNAVLDVNADAVIDYRDGIALANFLFAGGGPPPFGLDCFPIEGCPANDACP